MAANPPMTHELNPDFSAQIIIQTREMDWQESPSPGVWRKRLDLVGPVEAGRVTSIVRYDPGSSFTSHPHPDGEEILVLEGTFSDHTGDYAAGSYLLNPEGFSHAPFTEEGCVLFVKLRQYPGLNRQHVLRDINKAEWQDSGDGRSRLPLFEDEDYPEVMWLNKMAPGTEGPVHDHPGGEEIFIIEGGIEDELGHHGAGTWLRYPPGSRHQVASPTGATVYIKTGHIETAHG